MLGPTLVRALGSTWRIELEGDRFPDPRPGALTCIYCFWHQDLLMPLYIFRRTRVTVMTSQHRDGQISKAVMESLGFETVSGSSTRGGAAALRAFLRLSKSKRQMCIPPDGPRGPARVAKHGAVYLSSRAGVPIIPAAAVATRAWRLGSWDRMIVPKPFSRVVMRLGPSILVPRDANDDALRAWARHLGDALDATRDALEQSLGVKTLTTPPKQACVLAHASRDASSTARR